jgi:Tfp pilus assembly protein PilN
LGEFATHWHALATARPQAIPVIRPVQRGFDGQRQRQFGMAGAALAILLCVSHFVVARQQQSGLAESLIAMNTQEQQLRKQVEQLERTLRATEGESQQQRAKREADAQRIAESRRRLAEHDAARRFPSILMQALSSTADPGHHLAKIELAANRVTLSGLALNGQAVAKLAQQLDQHLASVAWRVQPPEMNSSGLGPLVSFQLTLVPTVSSKMHLTDRRSGRAYVQ